MASGQPNFRMAREPPGAVAVNIAFRGRFCFDVKGLASD